VKTIFWSNR